MREDGIRRAGTLLLLFVIVAVVLAVAGIGATVADGLEGFELSPTTTTSAP